MASGDDPQEQQRVPPWWTDPTENVKVLVDAAMQRQDDLREMESEHVRELMARDREFATAMRKAETERIDAIRAVDVGAVQRAAEVQATQAATLAGQVATTADAFRASLAAALAPIQASIEDLRRAQYEAQGQKTQVVEARQGTAMNLNIVGAVIAAIVLVIGLYATFHH